MSQLGDTEVFWPRWGWVAGGKGIKNSWFETNKLRIEKLPSFPKPTPSQIEFGERVSSVKRVTGEGSSGLPCRSRGWGGSVGPVPAELQRYEPTPVSGFRTGRANLHGCRAAPSGRGWLLCGSGRLGPWQGSAVPKTDPRMRVMLSKRRKSGKEGTAFACTGRQGLAPRRSPSHPVLFCRVFCYL